MSERLGARRKALTQATDAAVAPPASPVPPRGALLGLVASNALAVALALWQGWSFGFLLWPFWIQSVVIGWYNVRRMLALQRFAVDGFQINGRPAQETPQTRRSTAGFFVLHFGTFHFVYLLFLLTLFLPQEGEWPWIALATAGFVLHHRFAFVRFRAADRTGRPNIGSMMFLPYVRVFPMHLAIIGGAAFLGSGATGWAIVIFGALKTLADVLMELWEQSLIDKGGRGRR